MENIHFFLKENESSVVNSNNSILSVDELNTFMNSHYVDAPIEELEQYYASTYNVKQLTHILHYYGIQKKGKITKDELIQLVLFFELEPANKDVVQRRMRLWHNIEELKNDSYFSKYILFC
jgi:hypothetical protein